MVKNCSEAEERLRVLFFSTFVSRESGASYALQETIKRVETRGVSPLVVVPNSEDSRYMFPSNMFDVIYLPIHRPRRTWNPLIQIRYWISFPSTLFTLRRLIHQRGIHIVHFNEITDYIAGMAAHLCRVQCVCHVRADRPPEPYRWLLLSVLKRTVSAIVVPSKSTGAWIVSDAHDLVDRTRLIHDFAFNIDDYDLSVSGSDFRREIGVPPDEILVVLVSKLINSKGHLCFVQAAGNVIRRSTQVTFVIVGGAVPGHESEADGIRSLADLQCPPPGLRFVGPRSDLPSIYAACDIAVHCPVYPDTFPTVVLLAMLMGKPVIGSNIGGIPEQIQDGETGVLVPPGNSRALADAILELSQDSTKRKRLGLAAMRKIRLEFAPEQQAGALAELYAQVTRKVVLGGDHGHHSAPVVQSKIT
jgi:glycosyltransferase involved in cell wall biosynthesis